MTEAPARANGRRVRRPLLPGWRRDQLRTTLWVVPSALVVAAGLLFVITYLIDWSVYGGHLHLPSWIRTGGADAGRQVLTAIAAVVITVIGVVFSITILALTLASQQFGPRMLRNFVRDIGTQLTLGVFVATFVYAVLALGSITKGPRGEFVPHVSITVALAMLLGDLFVLMYFIHHIAVSIQLPEVIAGIAKDLSNAIDEEFPPTRKVMGDSAEVVELRAQIEAHGRPVPAPDSGYLQFVARDDLVAIASDAEAIIRLQHRPGHFILAGRPLVRVWPPETADRVGRELARTHVTGPHRTLIQDPVFAIDQLVEIAIRALSPAVNDTFTALTCIDWLADGLSKVSTRFTAEGVYRDRVGKIRLITLGYGYARMVNRSFDKIRQAARGMPAVAIRLMESIGGIVEYTHTPQQRQVLRRQAEMILRDADAAIPEEQDRFDVHLRYDQAVAAMVRIDHALDEPSPRRSPRRR